MKYNTRYGKTIEISIEDYLRMTDDELQQREENEGTPLYPFDPMYSPLENGIEFTDSVDNFIDLED